MFKWVDKFGLGWSSIILEISLW